MCKNGIDSPETRRPVRLWVIALAHLGKNIRASWQESAGDLSLLASHLLEFAFLPRVSKRGKTCFSVSAHMARKFFRLFLKLHSSPNGSAPASFMQGYCNGLPTNKKHFFWPFLMRIFYVWRLAFSLILACNIRYFIIKSAGKFF